MTEQEARDLIAKALEAEGWPNTAASLMNGGEGSMHIAIRALLPLLSTSELERRALEACEQYADMHPRMRSYEVAAPVAAVLDVGRESLAAKKPKGPWRVEGHRAIHESGRSLRFYDESGGNHYAACAEWVREQNEREAAR